MLSPAYAAGRDDGRAVLTSVGTFSNGVRSAQRAPRVPPPVPPRSLPLHLSGIHCLPIPRAAIRCDRRGLGRSPRWRILLTLVSFSLLGGASPVFPFRVAWGDSWLRLAQGRQTAPPRAFSPRVGGAEFLIWFGSLPVPLVRLVSPLFGRLAQNGFPHLFYRDPSSPRLVQNLRQRGSLFRDLMPR